MPPKLVKPSNVGLIDVDEDLLGLGGGAIPVGTPRGANIEEPEEEKEPGLIKRFFGSIGAGAEARTAQAQETSEFVGDLGVATYAAGQNADVTADAFMKAASYGVTAIANEFVGDEPALLRRNFADIPKVLPKVSKTIFPNLRAFESGAKDLTELTSALEKQYEGSKQAMSELGVEAPWSNARMLTENEGKIARWIPDTLDLVATGGLVSTGRKSAAMFATKKMKIAAVEKVARKEASRRLMAAAAVKKRTGSQLLGHMASPHTTDLKAAVRKMPGEAIYDARGVHVDTLLKNEDDVLLDLITMASKEHSEEAFKTLYDQRYYSPELRRAFDDVKVKFDSDMANMNNLSPEAKRVILNASGEMTTDQKLIFESMEEFQERLVEQVLKRSEGTSAATASRETVEGILKELKGDVNKIQDLPYETKQWLSDMLDIRAVDDAPFQEPFRGMSELRKGAESQFANPSKVKAARHSKGREHEFATSFVQDVVNGHGTLLGRLGRYKRSLGPRIQDHWFSHPAALIKGANRYRKDAPVRAFLKETIPKIVDRNLRVGEEMMAEAGFYLSDLDKGIARAVREGRTDGMDAGQMMEHLNDIRENRAGAGIERLPDYLQDTYERLGGFLDRTAQKMARQGLFNVDQLKTVRANMGRYLNRSYKGFRDKNWEHRVREINGGKVVDDAIESTHKARKKAKLDPITDEAAESQLFSELRRLSKVDQHPRPSPSKVIEQPLFGYMLERSNIPRELRQFFGEDLNFRTRFELSVRQLSHDYAVTRASTEIVEEARALGLVFDDASVPGHNVETVINLGPQQMGHQTPRRTVFTSPELSQLINQQVDATTKLSMFDNANLLNRMTGLWKLGKTVYSPVPTGVRNIMSNVSNMISTGDGLSASYWNQVIDSSIDSYEMVLNKTMSPARVQEELVLIREGLARSDVLSGEIQHYSTMRRGGMDAIPKAEWNELQVRSKAFERFMKEFYAQGDTGFKRAAVRHIAPQFEQAFKAADATDLLYLAREYGTDDPTRAVINMLNDTTQNYRSVSQGFQNLGKNPLIAPFVGFTYESMRNLQNNVRYIFKDMRLARDMSSPELKQFFLARAQRRIVGTGVVVGGAEAAKLGAEYVLGGGLDERQEEAMQRRGLSQYSANSVNVYTPLKDGKVGYIDAGQMNYYQPFKQMLTSMLNVALTTADGGPTDPNAVQAAWDAVDAFLGQVTGIEGFVAGVGEQFFNQKMEDSIAEAIFTSFTGEQGDVISDEPLLGYQMFERAGAARRQLLPTSINRAYDFTKQLFQGEPAKAASNLNPFFRYSEVDWNGMMYGAAKDWRLRMDNIRSSLNGASPEKRAKTKELWENEVWPAIKLELDDYRVMTSKAEVAEAFIKPLGKNTLAAAIDSRIDDEDSRVPKFNDVFPSKTVGITARQAERKAQQ